MAMSLARWFFGGLAATAILSVVVAAARGYRLTRLDFPLLLGTLFSSDRAGALRSGWIAHVLIGWLVAAVYAGLFRAVGLATWWVGLVIGLAQAALVLTVILPGLPAWHPRMTSPELGSTVLRRLEPPGFLGANYGAHTPEVVIVAHALLGLVLGVFFHR